MAGNSSSIPPASAPRFMSGRVTVKPKDMTGTLRRLWQLTRGQRKGLGVILLLAALSSASAVFSPYLTGKIISAIAVQDTVTYLLLLLLILYTAGWLIHFSQEFLMASISSRIIAHIRMILFNHLKTLPIAFFDRRQHGELMSRLTNDIDNISTTISNSLSELLTYGFTILGILVMMLRLSPLLTLISLFGVTLVFLLTKIVTTRTRKLFSERQKALGSLNGQVEESISALSVIKSFCREEATEKDFSEKNEKLKQTATKALVTSGVLMPLTNVINNLCYLLLAVFSALLFLDGKLESIGLITSFLLYVRQFNRPFVEIANIYNNFQTAVAGAERVFEIMDEPSEPADKPGAIELINPRGDFVLNHVNFGYTPERLILKDICLKIPAGTQVAVVGPTGSGKTTLINLLTRFYDVSGGEILLDGHDVRDYQMKSLRDSFSVVLQDTALFAISVLDNIRYGHSEASEEDVRHAAKVAGADSFIERLPGGYQTILTQGGSELSQGERQLLTIARAVLANAPIVILDEATSSVDTVTERKIQKAMTNMCRGRTSFIIAHRLSTIRDSDLIILIEDGRITEKGSHQSLMEQNGKYASLFRLQTGIDEV